MLLVYYCEDCCKRLGKYFSRDAENMVGRKRCSCCGTNEPDYFTTELESEIDY